MISLDLNLKNKTIKQVVNHKRKIQNNNKMENKKNLRIKIKVANRKLKNLNLLLKKILRKTRKGKTNQITTVFKKEVFKNLINLKKLNKINIPILILKV